MSIIPDTQEATENKSLEPGIEDQHGQQVSQNNNNNNNNNNFF
jgi:hypothetical protein